jgi:hypothetical protein
MDGDWKSDEPPPIAITLENAGGRIDADNLSVLEARIQPIPGQGPLTKLQRVAIGRN